MPYHMSYHMVIWLKLIFCFRTSSPHASYQDSTFIKYLTWWGTLWKSGKNEWMGNIEWFNTKTIGNRSSISKSFTIIIHHHHSPSPSSPSPSRSYPDLVFSDLIVWISIKLKDQCNQAIYRKSHSRRSLAFHLPLHPTASDSCLQRYWESTSCLHQRYHFPSP